MTFRSSDTEAVAGDLLAAALALAEQGLPVFPVKPRSKVPATVDGFKSATVDAEQLRAWWERWPNANVGVPTGAVSGFVVLDVDARHGGLASLEKLRDRLPKTAQVLTGSGGFHHWFRYAGELRNSAGLLGVGLDVRGDGGYVVAPPSVHETGNPYKWLHGLEEAVAWPAELTADRRNGAGAKVAEVIPEGQRRAAMLTVAGKLKRTGLSGDEILPSLRELNKRCRPPLDEAELRSVAYPSTIEAAETLGEAAYDGPTRALDDVVATFQRHLHMPDPASLLLTLATIVANMMEEGDPVWLVNIGGSSRGKTETVAALDGFPGVRIVGALTVAALLSGTPKKDRAKTATGGILPELGDRGVLVVKDFGALLTLHRDARAQVLQALRDIYDGLYTRDVGVDGGTKLRWEGRLGLIAGATSALDSAHGVLSALGERWVTTRLPDGGEREMVHVALADTDTRAAREELRDVVHGFLSTLEAVPLRRVSADELELFSALAPLVVLARSPVERDSYKRDIVHVHSPEGPARIVRQLHKLLVSLEAMGVDQPAGLILRAGLDSIPSPRRDVLVQLLRNGEQSTSDVATALGLASTNTSRALEDLAAHRLLTRRKAGDAATSANLWTPAEHIVEYWQTLDRFRPETA
jgi:hypothetical protein